VVAAALKRDDLMAERSPTVRVAVRDDVAAIAEVQIASSNDAYAPLAAQWSPMDRDQRAATWAKSIAEARHCSVVLVAEGAAGRV
jgi:hypothetical protein